MLTPTLKRSDFVRQLTPETVIDGNNAFIDRVEVDIGDWLMSGTHDQICDALSDLRHAHIPTNDGGSVPLFNSHIIERFYDIRGLRFSANPRADAMNRPAALISGTVARPSWRYRTIGLQPGETERIVFKTQLNLTRFLQAQSLHYRTRHNRPRLAANYSMAISPDPSWYVDELPLLPSTNIIIGPNHKYAFALRDSRAVQMRDCLVTTQNMLEEVMNEAFYEAEATTQIAPYFALRSIEFYWEFDAQSPIDFVTSLRDRVMQHGEVVSEDFYDVSNASIRTTNQSPCVSINLTHDIKVKIYAKTTKRVRFEVRIKDGAINTTAGQRSHGSIDGLIALIPRLADEAATRLSPILQSIVAAPPPRSSATAIQLMYLISQNANEPYVAEAIIAALVSFGRVVPYNNDPLLGAIHRLRDLGVLRTLRPRSRIYVVSDDYRCALDSLRQYR